MKKVLMLYGEISSYNVATFNEIAKEYDLTLAFYTKDKSKLPCDFKKIKLESKKYGPFVFIIGLRELCKQYDVVCFIPDMHVPSYCILPFISHNYKTVTWSIGFRCSYVHPFIVNRRHVLLDWVFLQILRKANSNIFYMEESRKFWKGSDLDMDTVFVAPNTTDVLPIEFQSDKKKDLLFVGTLYKGKGLDKLLSSIKVLVAKGYNNIHLTIVGDGECRNELESFVNNNNLKENVTFTGAIYEEEELSKHFSEALMCISPTQGGMSCPKSMGYGVPFITRKDAITGGEIYHIENGINGILYNNDDELTTIIEESCINPDKYIKMGLLAKEYYENNATVKHMAQGAIKAFEYALKK